VVPLLAGCKKRLPLPASFIGTMGKNPPMSFMVEDGSGGQPLYHIEVHHDKEGKSYLTEGWAQFFTDYGLERGWSHLDPPFQVAHPLRPHHRWLRLRPRLLPLAVIGESPRSPLFDSSTVNRGIGVRGGSSFAILALSMAYIM
jgi:hypothetical protein